MTAKQFDGSFECANRLADEHMNNIRPEFISEDGHARFAGTLYVETPEGFAIAEPGDWLIEVAEGRFHVRKSPV